MKEASDVLVGRREVICAGKLDWGEAYRGIHLCSFLDTVPFFQDALLNFLCN